MGLGSFATFGISCLCPKACSGSRIPRGHVGRAFPPPSFPPTPAPSPHPSTSSSVTSGGQRDRGGDGSCLRPLSLQALDTVPGLGEKSEAPGPGSRPAPDKVEHSPQGPRSPEALCSARPGACPQSSNLLIFYSEYASFLQSENHVRRNGYFCLFGAFVSCPPRFV